MEVGTEGVDGMEAAGTAAVTIMVAVGTVVAGILKGRLIIIPITEADAIQYACVINMEIVGYNKVVINCNCMLPLSNFKSKFSLISPGVS
jgi:hypothetical protein